MTSEISQALPAPAIAPTNATAGRDMIELSLPAKQLILRFYNTTAVTPTPPLPNTNQTGF